MIKRFRSSGSVREWAALRLLAEHAPGLGPMPVSLVGDTVVMSRLVGGPLGVRPVSRGQVTAMAAAMTTLHTAVPARVLADLPSREWTPSRLVLQVRSWCAEWTPHPDPLVARAFSAAERWLSRSGIDSVASAQVSPVFGQGDGNLANYLWDGSAVRLVDFEESGVSDRVYEIAEVTEHVRSWVHGSLNVAALLARFELTAAEVTRLTALRRLLALVWFLMLARDGSRNPPGTLERQAGRLLELLDG